MKTSALVLLLLLAGIPPVDAQSQAGPGWPAMLGCWQLIEERSRNESVASRTCLAPASIADAAVATTSLSDGTSRERTIVADGQPHPVDIGACRGTERAEWSADRRRLFRRAQLSCEGSPAVRDVSGVAFLVNGSTLLEIESSGPSVEVRRFFREGDRPAAVEAAAGPFTIADVREASSRVAPLVIEAAIVESHARFSLDGSTLLALDTAGVDDHVIDLMVAVSYPRSFVVDRPGVPPGRVSGGGGGGGGFFGPGLDIYSSAEYGLSPWDPFFYGWTYFGYQPYFFGRGRYQGGGWSIAPGIDGGSGGGGGSPEDGPGVAVNQQGYTRVRTTAEVAVTRGEGRAVVSGDMPAARAGSSDGDSGGGASSGSSGSSGASAGGGYSSGGGGDGGRTAVPR
jgi:hypothetical protein